jgi:hypothetical protein
MATGSGAFSAKCGFNQSGGGYYMSLETTLYTKAQSYAPGSGSGGATTVGTFVPLNTVLASGVDTSSLSSVSGQYQLLKDLGRTIVSSGRTFRKFQAVFPTANNSSVTFGVGGSTLGNGYLGMYLEVGRDGATAPVKLARYA